MEITFIGLGRMGNAMTAHLVEAGVTVHGFDVAEAAREAAQKNGVQVHKTVADAISAQTAEPKLIWIMVPAEYVDTVLTDVVPHLTKGDVIVDGGNSFYKESVRRHKELQDQNLHFIDCGVSGGIEGARSGASLMVGGEAEIISKYDKLFTTLATKNGFARVGNAGAGHYVKMVHNGIEYGMMNALAEGLYAVEEGEEELGIDTTAVLQPYENGSIISSSLMSWLANAYLTTDYLETIAGTVPKGETEEEMEHLVETSEFLSLEAALAVRKDTRVHPSRVGTLISAMRNGFGGHNTIEKDGNTN